MKKHKKRGLVENDVKMLDRLQEIISLNRKSYPSLVESISKSSLKWSFINYKLNY